MHNQCSYSEGLATLKHLHKEGKASVVLIV